MPVLKRQLGDSGFIQFAQSFRDHRVVLLLGGARQRKIEAKLVRQIERDAAVFGGMRGGEKTSCGRGFACLRHRSAERARRRRFAKTLRATW